MRLLYVFFFNDTATTEIYTLSLHDALPISSWRRWVSRWPLPGGHARAEPPPRVRRDASGWRLCARMRSEEHTSELQSLAYIVCRLLLEKKKAAPISAAAGPAGGHAPP